VKSQQQSSSSCSAGVAGVSHNLLDRQSALVEKRQDEHKGARRHSRNDGGLPRRRLIRPSTTGAARSLRFAIVSSLVPVTEVCMCGDVSCSSLFSAVLSAIFRFQFGLGSDLLHRAAPPPPFLLASVRFFLFTPNNVWLPADFLSTLLAA